ncbi:MAG: methyltransferase domain-containing protein [Propionibacteriaceae bacterium]|nr:methyltransferase domain-containing protein [Propionibacteriaceae bacterium]
MSIGLVTSWLACPVCGGGLSLAERTLRCQARHSFDIAKQGYVNLSQKAAPPNADTPAMVAARQRFLAGGHFGPLAQALASRLRRSRRILDVGAGCGYYLAAALDANPEAVGLATDVSPAACRAACRAHGRAAAIVADTWAGLPLRPGSVDALLCVFAPRNPDEFWRVLSPGGLLVVATPTGDHLAELRRDLGLLGIDPDKTAELKKRLAAFTPVGRHPLRWTMALSPQEVTDAIAMGPNAFHQDAASLTVGLPGTTQATGSVEVQIFRKPASPV